MPIYEYQCEKCGREFEEWQKFSDPPVSSCSRCGGKTRRLISHSSFVLKGTGWYVTDYARKDSGNWSSAPPSKPSTTPVSSSDSGSGSSSSSDD